MLVITIQEHIEKAQEGLVSRLAQECRIRIPARLGYRGGYEECAIFWSDRLGLYFYSKELQSRYWNAFGLSEERPQENSMMLIICEINPPIKGLDRKVQGAFAQDDKGHTWLLHRGRIGGGRPGIGRRLFFDNFRGEAIRIHGDRFAVVGNMNTQGFVEHLRDFVEEVDRIKALVA